MRACCPNEGARLCEPQSRRGRDLHLRRFLDFTNNINLLTTVLFLFFDLGNTPIRSLCYFAQNPGN